MKINDINLNISEEEYRASGRLSYSRLAAIHKDGPEGARKVFDSTTAMDFGTVVDMLLTDPESLESKVFTTPIDIPTASSGELFNAVVNTFDYITEFDINSENTQSHIKDVAKALNLWSNVTDETKWIKKVLTYPLLNALDLKWKSKGKVHLSEQDWNLANHIVDTLKNHKYTKNIFDVVKNEELIFQFTLNYVLLGVDMQSRLDIVKVNHKTKTINLYDLKTGYPKIEEFSGNYYKYGYHIQEGLYYSTFYDIMKIYPEFREYKLNPFKFIYISKQQPDSPLIYNGIGMDRCFGGFKTKSGKYYKGIKELILDYKFHTENDEFNYTREMVENNGVININTNFIE